MKDHIYAQRIWAGTRPSQYTKSTRLQHWRVTAELGRIGTQAPYFSLTYDEHGPDGEACGAGHDRCVELAPACAPFVRWHLTSPDGPMHYRANALYWAGYEAHTNAAGVESIRPSRWVHAPVRPGSPNPPHWPFFASTVVLGSVYDDPTLESGVLQAMTGAELAAWLDARLARLLGTFRTAMDACFPDNPAGVAEAFAYDARLARGA